MSEGSATWDDSEFPLAYLITIRTFGTWLHGDERGSVDRHHEKFSSLPTIPPNPKLESIMSENAKLPKYLLSKQGRKVVEDSVPEVCKNRMYDLFAVNVRTNHVHAVISAQIKPEKIINTIKSYATGALKSNGLADAKTSVWSRGGSRRYLWKQGSVTEAVDYVLYSRRDDFLE